MVITDLLEKRINLAVWLTGLSPLEFFLHLLAHDKLLDFAGDRHGKLCNKTNITGDFEVRDLAFAKVFQRLLAQGGPWV
jgi:hypothetical protein